MRIFQNNSEYQGTPEELDLFLRLREPNTIADNPWAEMEPLRDIVSESEELRRKLAENPDYSPFGGVVSPQDSEQNTLPIKKIATAEIDTGVELI